MPQLEVLGRTLRILHGTDAGTAFTMEVNNVQYIVTAKHLFEKSGYPSSAQIGIYENKNYVFYDVDIKYPTDPNVDIAVLKTTPYTQLTALYPTTFSSANITIGQDVYFLGFPYNYDSLLCNMPGDKYPLPFIKKACLSSYIQTKGIFLLDGHNNSGFSGGPVCFKKAGSKTYNIAGVVASYRYEELSVYDSNKKETDMVVRANTGIINVYDIKFAVEIATNWP